MQAAPPSTRAWTLRSQVFRCCRRNCRAGLQSCRAWTGEDSTSEYAAQSRYDDFEAGRKPHPPERSATDRAGTAGKADAEGSEIASAHQHIARLNCLGYIAKESKSKTCNTNEIGIDGNPRRGDSIPNATCDVLHFCHTAREGDHHGGSDVSSRRGT